MMSSEQTETKVFGLLPNKQHLPPLNSHASTVLCFPPILNQVGGWREVSQEGRRGSDLFFFGADLPHIMSWW